MRGNGLHREELRHRPLNVESLEGIGVITGPQLPEIFKRGIVAAGTATRAEHHLQLGVFGMDTVEDLIQSADMVDIHVALLRLLVW